jgi:hypothetical protein
MTAGRQAGRTALVTGAARGPMIQGEVVRHYFPDDCGQVD